MVCARWTKWWKHMLWVKLKIFSSSNPIGSCLCSRWPFDPSPVGVIFHLLWTLLSDHQLAWTHTAKQWLIALSMLWVCTTWFGNSPLVSLFFLTSIRSRRFHLRWAVCFLFNSQEISELWVCLVSILFWLDKVLCLSCKSKLGSLQHVQYLRRDQWTC